MNNNDYPTKLFAALANPTRWKMLQLLDHKSVRSIAELARIFKLSHVAVTKHIATLEKVNLVTRQIIGKYHRIEVNQTTWEKIKIFQNTSCPKID